MRVFRKHHFLFECWGVRILLETETWASFSFGERLFFWFVDSQDILSRLCSFNDSYLEIRVHFSFLFLPDN